MHSQSRARQACLRCRQQKLKCDNARPCALCVRSSVTCREVPAHLRKRKPAASRTPQTKINQDAPVIPLDDAEHVERRRENAVAPTEGISSPNILRGHVSEHGLRPQSGRTRVSTYGLLGQLLHHYEGAEPRSYNEADAIPDGTSPESFQFHRYEKAVLVSELIDWTFPPARVTWMLFDAFIDSVHWFMMLFHEPFLRSELAKILQTGRAYRRQKSLLQLLMVVLANGSRYLSETTSQQILSEGDLKALQSDLMTKLEATVVEFINEDVESVSACILLGSLYLYHRQPRRCFVLNGTALRLALSMGLHREAHWGQMSIIERETRRRVWWALYVCEGYGAITFGAPCAVLERDYEVRLPQNIDDTSDVCPGFNSQEDLDSGCRSRVTILTYQRLKFKLYRIAAPITRELYFRQDLPMHERVRLVQQLNDSLRRWESTIPAELRPGSFSTSDANHQVGCVTRIFRLQALSLQLSYDNIQLILHRPFLFSNGSLSLLGPSRAGSLPLAPGANTAQVMDADDEQSRQFAASRSQCWESALKTSRIGEHSDILRQASKSHLAGFIGIQMFTAGVTLAVFALTRPLSSQANEAKRGIGQLIKVPKGLGFRTVISDQSSAFLERLLRLMMAQEIKLLTTNEDAVAPSVVPAGLHDVRQQPVTRARNATTNTRTMSTYSNIEVSTADSYSEQGTFGVSGPSGEGNDLQDTADTETGQCRQSDEGASYAQVDLSSYETLQDNHLLSILPPEFPSQTPLERSQQQQQQPPPPPALEEFYDFSHESIPFTTAWSGSDDIGQSWIWDDLFQT